MESKVPRLIYTLFVGVLISIFVGVGINTFYAEPVQPAYVVTYADKPVEENIVQNQEYDKEYTVYTDKSNIYNRNVSIITLTAAVLLMAVSLYYEKKIKVLADGVMLGGLFTLIYSIIRGFMSSDSRSVFVIIAAGLICVLFIGYHRFVKAPKSKKKKR